MAATVVGPRDPVLVRDDNYDRTYTVTWLVRVDHEETLDANGLVTARVLDGPQTALEADGLPQPGDTWSFGSDNDGGAWCRPGAEVRPDLTAEPNTAYLITFTFSSKPLPNCQLGVVEDPLLVPPKITLGSRKVKEEYSFDRFGDPLEYSSHEPIRGPKSEFDRTIQTIRIEQNVAVLDPGLDLVENCVNGEEIWGKLPRTVILSRATQECRFTGTCESYVSRVLEFEVDVETWDRVVLDESNLVLLGKWVGKQWVLDEGLDPANPQHYMRAIDRAGNYTRFVLDGQGRPADVTVLSGLWISIAVSTPGLDLDVDAAWVPLVGGAAGQDWTGGEDAWWRGNVVIDGGEYFVALEDVPAGETAAPADAPEKWASIGTVPIDLGTFDIDTAYGVGSVVTDAGTVRPPGRRVLSVFSELDFALLGVPLELECSQE